MPSIKILLFSYSTRILSKFPLLSLNLSRIFIGKSFLIKIATPLDCESKLEKNTWLPHSVLTVFSISFEKRVSIVIKMSGFFLRKKCKTCLRFGLRPMLFALKLISLNFEAELPPLEELLSIISYHAGWWVLRDQGKTKSKFIEKIHYCHN